MDEDPRRVRVDPRSPVQPGPSALPYLLLAMLALAIGMTLQSDWAEDISSPSVPSPQPAASEPHRGGPRKVRGDMRTLFTADDYPAEAQRLDQQGTVRVRLYVNEKGRVTRCEIVESSTYASLDAATCKILQRRARFSPARDTDGKPVAGTIVSPAIVWRLEA